MTRDFVLPDLGEGISEAQIVRLLVQQGDRVAEDQYLMEVETDKAAVEIPSPYAGIAITVHVKEGQTVNVGDVIVSFDGEGGTASDASSQVRASDKKKAAARGAGKGGGVATMAPPQVPSVRTAPAAGAVPSAAAAALPSRKTSAVAAPAVRKLAREMRIDLDSITGTGPGGRITREDVERFAAGSGGASSVPVAAAATAAHPVDFVSAIPEGVADLDKWGAVRRVPLSQIRKTIATQISRSAFTIPHVTHGDEADISELERIRQQLNEITGGHPKLTPMSFLIRAICLAFRKFPIFNASFDEEGGQILYKEYVNMGIAVDTERGLIVPVIRDANKLSLRGIALALRSIADRIRSNQFAIEDLRGGTFTITNVGALGGTFSTPIINYPEVAIVGLGRSHKVPVLRDGALAEELRLPLALSFDHRATDGANAARFTREIISYLENPALFLLD